MRDVTVFDDAEALAEAVADRFLSRIATTQAEGRTPHVALTGGTVARQVHSQIAARAHEHAIDWAEVVFWFGDERFVSRDSPERNELQARHDFLDAVGANRIHPIPSTDEATSASEAADAYADDLRANGTGDFDLVMLGMGPDGHVASLFPGHPQLHVEDAIAVAVTDSPKPPPRRVSLTFGALNRSRAVWFLVTGAEKADATQRAWAFDGSIDETPARGISGPSVTWFVDQAAAGS
jgi:6-phosphogluconolactonase